MPPDERGGGSRRAAMFSARSAPPAPIASAVAAIAADASRRVNMMAHPFSERGVRQDRPLHQRLEHRRLVGVAGERRRAFERGPSRLGSEARVDSLSVQRRLCRTRPPWRRRGGAEHDRGAPASAAHGQIENDRNICQRPIERFLLRELQMLHAQTGRRRQQHGRQEFVGPEVVLTLDVLVRPDEEVLERDAARSFVHAGQLSPDRY